MNNAWLNSGNTLHRLAIRAYHLMRLELQALSARHAGRPVSFNISNGAAQVRPNLKRTTLIRVLLIFQWSHTA